MKRIAVCDDEARALCELQQFLEEYQKEYGTALEIVAFSSARELLRSASRFDLILLDIQMEGLSGMDAAKKLRGQGVTCPIIFLTALKEYVFEAFEVDALNYLLKPVDKEKLFRSVRKGIAENCSELLVKQGYDYRKIPVSDILYCESVGRKVSIHTAHETIEYYQKIKELPAVLGKIFYMVHRSFLLNLDHLSAVDGNDALLDNGERIPIARGKKEDLVKRLLEHFQEKN